MNPALDKALYYLTGNGNIDEVSTESLEKLTHEYPYFAIGHLLLAKKQKVKEDQHLQQQVQKAAVYFTNPYWLHYQLLNYPPSELALYNHAEPATTVMDSESHEAALVANSTSVTNEDIGSPVAPINLEEENTTELDGDAVYAIEDSEAENVSAITYLPDEEVPVPAAEEPVTEVFSKDELDHASELAHEALSEDLTDENFTPTSEPVLEVHNEPVPITTTFTADELEHASDLAHTALADEPFEATISPGMEEPVTEKLTSSELNEASELAHEVLQPGSGTVITQTAVNEESSFTSYNEPVETATNQAEEEMAAITREPDPETEQFINEVTSPGTKAENIIEAPGAFQPLPMTEEDEHEKMFQSIKAMLDATTDEAGKDTGDAIIPIDPYHTVDYFASQGIKLELEANPQDKLGKQLKKFTSWLKQMKKLGPEDAIESIESEEEVAAVQQIADTSNTAREVVTEAMAQVLEKQGKKEKAIQLYTKLSFLNPHKSAYFADKIKNLKGI